MSGYVYFTDDQKQRASAVDLEGFFTRQGERPLRSGREKRLDSDRSITMRGNEWYDRAVGKGGLAIDFVQIFYGRSFLDVVTTLLGRGQGQPCRPKEQCEPESPKPLILPKAHSSMCRVFAYLTKTRCLDRSVVSAFAKAKPIYEDNQYHNTVFAGVDKDGVARHARRRGVYTQGDVFKGNVDGCDPKYSLHFTGQSDTVCVLEASIDLLSFIPLCQKD